MYTYHTTLGTFEQLTSSNTIDDVRIARNIDDYVLVFVQQEEKTEIDDILDAIEEAESSKTRNDMLDAMTYGIEHCVDYKSHSLRKYNLDVHDDDKKYVNAEHPEHGTVRQERKYKHLYDRYFEVSKDK